MSSPASVQEIASSYEATYLRAERERERRIALRGLKDLWFLGSVLLKLGMEEGKPRPREEIEPIYKYFDKPRPKHLDPDEKWFRALCVPRYLAKTYIALVWILREILKDPNVTIAYHCAEKDQAIEGVRLVREWLDLPIIQHLYGTHQSRLWSPEKGLVSALRTAGVEKNPTLRALGMDKPLEGKRANHFVCDDLIGETTYNKPEQVIKVERRRAAIVPLVKDGGILWWLATRWGIMDPMADGKTFSGEDGILKKWKQGEWDCFGARGFVGAYAHPGDEEFFPYLKKNPQRTKTGKVLVFPSVWNERSIEIARREMPFGLHASQVLNDPLPEENRHFSEKSFQHFSLEDPEREGRLNPLLGGCFFVLALDPNKSADQLLGSDRHAFAVLGLKLLKDIEANREFWQGYLVEWIAGRWKISEVCDKYFELVEKWKPRRHFIETNAGGAWITDPIKKRGKELGYSKLPIEEVQTNKTSKDDRILTSLQPAYAYGQILHAEHLIGGDGEVELLRWMPNQAAHDDLVDVLEIAWSNGTMKRFGGVHTPEGVKKPLVARTWRRKITRYGGV